MGKITSDKKFSHEIYGEKFYRFSLSIARLSGNADIIKEGGGRGNMTDENGNLLPQDSSIYLYRP